MKITELELLRVPPSWVWVRIHTDLGITGLGEPFLESHPDVVMAEVRRLESSLVGQDPTRIEYLWNMMYRSGSAYVGGPVKMSAISGIDMALWDITGKAEGLPVHRLMGGAYRDRVKMYRATGGGMPHTVEPGEPYRAAKSQKPAEPPSLQVFAQAAATLVNDWGFRCLKAHFGVGQQLIAVDDVPRIAEQFAAVREGAGSDIPVAIDIHNPLPAVAAQLIEALAPHRPLFIEEPQLVERVEALERLLERASAPIAAGERWMGKWVFFDALKSGRLSVVQPDLCHAGGITECRKIAAMAEATGAQVALHCPLSPLALAASVQLDAVMPNFLVQEHNEVNDYREEGRTLIGKGFFREPFELDDDGCVAVPDLPGLGVEIDEEGMERIMSRPWSATRG